MGKRTLERDRLGRAEDWYGNNAAVRCPTCAKVYIVSAFLAKGQRQCPVCQISVAQITSDSVTIEWPDRIDEVRVLGRDELESQKRLDEFVSVVGRGGAIQRASIDAKLQYADKIAFIERDGKMAAVAAVKKIRANRNAEVAKKSGYPLSTNIPEIGYVAVECDWRGLHLSGRLVDKVLEFCGGSVFATTSEPRMKSVLAYRSFRWVGNEWPSSTEPNKLLSLWIKEHK